jgi:acetoin utilization deacetylase AcuC-like enzyme
MIPVWIDLEHKKHETRGHHPEDPRRLGPVLNAIRDLPITLHVRDDPVLKDLDFMPRHTGGDMYWTPYTKDLLKRGREMIEEACATLLSRREGCAFVLIRPPGHHSDNTGSAEGFCHQNNAWIAATLFESAGLSNITILDWDAHHGDGTESYIKASGTDTIRFCSLHAYGPNVYPGTGAELMTPTLLNVPLPVGTRTRTYMKYFQTTVVPWIKKPDVIIVSAGYDGHREDPMELLGLDESAYKEMSAELKKFGCPVLFLLEGGYNPEVLGTCVKATLDPWRGGTSHA